MVIKPTPAPKYPPPRRSAWRPSIWGHIAGNDEPKGYLSGVVATPTANIALTGPAGSGKTALATVFARAYSCERHGSLRQACGTCGGCQQWASATPDAGLFAELHVRSNPEVPPAHVFVVDGTEGVDTVLHAYELAKRFCGRKLILLDEARELAASAASRQLRRPLEDVDVLFVLTGVDFDGADTQFVRRFRRLQTRFPTPAEVATFVADWRGGRVRPERGWSQDDFARSVSSRLGCRCSRVVEFLLEVEQRNGGIATRRLLDEYADSLR